VKVNVKVQHKNSNKLLTIPSTLQNYYMKCEADQKLSLLVHFLAKHSKEKIIVYFLTCACVNFFWKIITTTIMGIPDLSGLSVLSLHGKIPTKKRTGIMETFLELKKGVLFTTDVAARGVDFADNPIDWIVQYDAPQDPSFFIHRIGRTARMGAIGSALLFLQSNEHTYIDFLQLRKVPLMELPNFFSTDNVNDIVPSARERVKRDRDLFDKSEVAIVSYLRAYKEHKLNYIFIFKDLNFSKLFNGFLVLKLPKMPELKQIQIKDFTEENTQFIHNIPYRDKTKEKQRQQKIKMLAQTRAIKQHEKHQKKKKWEQKQKRKEKRSNTINTTSATHTNSTNSKDEEELLREFALLKKLKKRRLVRVTLNR